MYMHSLQKLFTDEWPAEAFPRVNGLQELANVGTVHVKPARNRISSI